MSKYHEEELKTTVYSNTQIILLPDDQPILSPTSSETFVLIYPLNIGQVEADYIAYDLRSWFAAQSFLLFYPGKHATNPGIWHLFVQMEIADTSHKLKLMFDISAKLTELLNKYRVNYE